jgi:UDP-2,3-diacylglucosamine hydrolase
LNNPFVRLDPSLRWGDNAFTGATGSQRDKLWFVSDVHLSDSKPRMTRLFFHFLRSALTKDVAAIYLLGDIFEYWLGQDMLPDFFSELQAVCENLHQHGIALYFLPGNRDFLLDPEAAKQLHWQLLPDCYTIFHQHRTILVTHGDLLCESEWLYQLYRTFSHLSWVKKGFLVLPVVWRQKIAGQLRKLSYNRSSVFKPAITQDTALRYLKQYGANVLIHGHVHYPAAHAYEDWTPACAGVTTHFILSDWRESEGNYAQYCPSKMELSNCCRVELPSRTEATKSSKGK